MQRTFCEDVRRGAHLDMKQGMVKVFWRRGASSRALKGILKGEQDWAREHMGKRCPEGTSNIERHGELSTHSTGWEVDQIQTLLEAGPGQGEVSRSGSHPASSGEALGISK